MIIFVLNSNHLNQQGTYENIILPASEKLSNSFQYDYGDENFVKTYPLWGYSLLLLPGIFIGHPDLWILFFQLILCYLVLSNFYKLSKRKPKTYDLFLFLPFISLMSVKWPDAIVAALIFFGFVQFYSFILDNSLKSILLSSLFIGLAFNFRSEYIFLPFILILVYFIIVRLYKLRLNSKVFSIFLSFVLLSPWVIRNYILTSDFVISSTNGGTVLYISLGQLENNKWDIEPVDATAKELTLENGYINQYEKSADDFLKSEFITLIKEDPFEYFKKVLSNTIKVFIGGVYTGEFSNLFLEKELREQIDRVVNDANGLEKFEALFLYGEKAFFSILTDKAIRFVYLLIWVSMIALVLFNYKKIIKKKPELTLLFFAIVLYKFALSGLIQYEYRHLNSIYLFLLILSSKSVSKKNIV